MLMDMVDMVTDMGMDMVMEQSKKSRKNHGTNGLASNQNLKNWLFSIAFFKGLMLLTSILFEKDSICFA